MEIRRTLMSALLTVPLMAGVAGVASAAERLNFYTTHSGTTLTMVKGMYKLSDEVKEETSGEVDIQVLLGGTLQIGAADVTGAVAQNVIQMADDTFFSGNVTLATILRVPGIIGPTSNMQKALDATNEAVEEAFAKKDVKVLGGYLSPPQYIWSTSVMSSIDDVKGQKLRVSSPQQAEFVKALGGVPIVLGSGEVSSALERGLVDGMLTSGSGGEYFGGPTKSVLLLPINYNNNYYLINPAAFDSLTPEQQQVLEERTRDIASWVQTNFLDEDNAAIDVFRARDDFAVVEPSEEDFRKAAEVSMPMWTAWADEQGEDGHKVLEAIRGALGN